MKNLVAGAMTTEDKDTMQDSIVEMTNGSSGKSESPTAIVTRNGAVSTMVATAAKAQLIDFEELCDYIGTKLMNEWCGSDSGTGSGDIAGHGFAGDIAVDYVELQKRAIMGYEREKEYIIGRVRQIIREEELSAEVPAWYSSAEEAVFHENWGLAGMAEWFAPEYAQSSSAKIIGSRIYFLTDGVMRLMPQRISDDRREQLVRALLLTAPDERLDRDSHEIYMRDGTRVTIYGGRLAKKGFDSIVFRRYIIPDYSFVEQAARGTIPDDAVPLFEHMVGCGFNVVFCGSVRSAKTTFLSTWQRYEDPALEGVMVETDPEIPIHDLMPNAPVIQLIADGENLAGISKRLMRSDADYFILAEARDGIALDTAVRLARKGSRRMKMTFHSKDPAYFARDAAVEIVRAVGGDIDETSKRVAGSFDYLFHFSSIRRHGASACKKLTAIYEMGLTDDGKHVATHEICRYDREDDSWRWTYHIGSDKRETALEEDSDSFGAFDICLKSLQGSVVS